MINPVGILQTSTHRQKPRWLHSPTQSRLGCPLGINHHDSRRMRLDLNQVADEYTNEADAIRVDVEEAFQQGRVMRSTIQDLELAETYDRCAHDARSLAIQQASLLNVESENG